MKELEEIRNGLIPLQLDTFLTDISREEECVFIYYK